jgi:hypothetical protein
LPSQDSFMTFRYEVTNRHVAVAPTDCKLEAPSVISALAGFIYTTVSQEAEADDELHGGANDKKQSF